MNSIITLIVVGALALVTTVRAADFYVAPTGQDSNPGTKGQPFATLPAARDAARLAGAGSHRIILMPGEYFLTKTLELDPRDNGLRIEAAESGKAILYGGQVITGWRRDGDKFWCADLPGVKEGTRDFRALVVNERLAERSRVPETGTLVHRSKFDVASLPAVAGYWARQPTLQERTALEYDPKDIPPTFEIHNAELRVYHSWDESLVGISSHDEPKHTFTLSPPARFPPGAFGIKKYVIFNTREGMTRPGQWYLDRVAGRVCYWPLAGEDMTKARAIAPVLECIINIAGTGQAPVQNLTLRGFALQATTTPLKPAGFAAMQNYDGALHLEQARQCVFEQLDISNVGGLGMLARELLGCQIRDCQIHHIGAGGASVTGARTLVARNHIHHVGLYYPSAAAMLCDSLVRTNVTEGLHILRNEVHDAPYCGIIIEGEHLLVEGNLVYRVMREMQDGAGIYGNAKHSLVRGNVVRDIVKMGEGTGVSAYYLDEGAEDTVFERNVSLGIERPTHNHITTQITLRDNVFISPTNMILSFQRSSGATFSNNIVVAPGKISVSPPNAVKVWTNNLVSFLFGMGMYSIMAFLPEFLQTKKAVAGYGFSASTNASGLFLLPMTVCMFVVGLYTGKIAARFGSKAAVILGSSVSATGFLLFALAHQHAYEIYGASAFLGIGLGLAFSAMSNLIVQAVAPSQTGIASGMNANIRTIGGAVGAGVASSIVTSKLLASGYPAQSGYTHAFLFMAGCTIVAVIAAIFIPTAKPDDAPHIHHAELAAVPGGTITEG